MEAKFTVDGECLASLRGLACKSIDDAIATLKKDILEEYPNAKNIVITEEPKNKGKPLLIDELVRLVKKDRPDLDDTHFSEYEFMLLTNPGRDSYRQGGYWHNLVDAKALFDDPNADYVDWVYIRRWGIVVFNVSHHTSHEMFLSNMNWILSNLLDSTQFTMNDLPCLCSPDNAEAYLHNCHGFFSSRVGYGRVTKSANMKLNAQERIAFAGMRFRELEP
jgi:hypothetical protein